MTASPPRHAPPPAPRRDHEFPLPPPPPPRPPSPPSVDPSPVPCLPADLTLDLAVDDDALSALEKTYLFCRSKTPTHRIFIARSLHTFLPAVSPSEAVEYVLPLLNGLAVDDDDAVREALVASLVPVMWWFFQNCQLIEDEPTEGHYDPPLLPVHTFTPILGSLLIDHNSMVGTPARFAVVDILNRLRAADDIADDRPPFGSKERKLLEQEIVHQVIIGMGRLDLSEDLPSPVSKPEFTPAVASPDKVTLLLPSLCPQDSLPTLPVPPVHPPPQGQQSHVSLPSVVPPSPSHHLEPTPCNSSNFACNPLDDGWLIAESQHNQDPQDDANEQAAIGRLSSMSLIATVTAHAKLPEDTIRAFVDEVAYIGGDPLYWVRREASFALGALAKVVPTEIVLLSLLPLFETLVQDSIWHVRHSALFALPGILTRLNPQHRRTLALKTLMSLAADAALAVRSGVLEVLGEVIYSFHQDDGGPPEDIVNLFVGREQYPAPHQHHQRDSNRHSSIRAKKLPCPLTSVFDDDDDDDDDAYEEDEATPSEQGGRIEPPGMFFCDPSRSLITSFNYPAVALSLGPLRWGEVRQYYLTLSREKNVCVRRTIAAGLGEMARILGSELALQDLVDIWQDMVHDIEDGQTRQKALEGVCIFVGALEGVAREDVMVELAELWERWLMGWRERECVTKALPTLAALVEGQGEVVRTLMGKALVDNIAAVRDAAIGALAHVLRAFDSRPHLAEALRDDLQDLACAGLCRRRATYVDCHRALAESENGEAEVSRDEFWKHLVQLSQDSVVDVRIGIARLIGIICEKYYPETSSRPLRISYIVRQLSQDPSRDVRAFVAFLLVAGEARSSPGLSRPGTPPMSFATFSRPPSKSPPLDVMMRMRDIVAEEDVSMGLAVREEGRGPEAVRRAGDRFSSRSEGETGDGRAARMR